MKKGKKVCLLLKVHSYSLQCLQQGFHLHMSCVQDWEFVASSPQQASFSCQLQASVHNCHQQLLLFYQSKQNREVWCHGLKKTGTPSLDLLPTPIILQRFSRVGPRGRGREWATLGVHPLSWLLSNNRLEEVCSTLTKGTFSSRLLLSNKTKGVPLVLLIFFLFLLAPLC